MGQGILVCGCNGSGKSTLGRALAEKLGYRFLDIEDFFFPKTNREDPYAVSRSREDAETLLRNEIVGVKTPFVLAAVRGNYGQDIVSSYRCAVFLRVPKEIRLQRIRDRSRRQFGDRMLPGGDLFEKEQAFFEMAASRSQQEIGDWLCSVGCPVLPIDGTQPVSESIEQILRELSVRSLVIV